MSQTDIRECPVLFVDLDIETDLTTHERALYATVAIATQYDRSAYDAAYLELALLEKLPLATLDQGLATAIVKAGSARLLMS